MTRARQVIVEDDYPSEGDLEHVENDGADDYLPQDNTAPRHGVLALM